MAKKNKTNTIELTRIYDAPLKAVWDAWADDKQVSQWWGPRGWSITTHTKDMKTGGFWSYTMYGPEGAVFENKTKYLEVVPMKKMVYDHGGNDDRPALFRVTVLFSEVNGKTKLEMSMALATEAEAEETRARIKKYGGNSTWDRLAEYLEKQATGKERFVIARTFDVPLALMFEVWTDPKHFAKWLPPTGATMEFIKADIRVGGTSMYVMTAGNGMKMYGKCHYREIRSPDRIVYTQEFCDEHGNMARHPMAPTWPATMLTTVTLAAEGPDQTRVSVQWEPYGEATSEEVATFVGARAGMSQGWGGSFDKLDEYAAALQG